jgi:hypothetical protein
MRPDSPLGYKLYDKPTHANLYLNSSFHHHTSNRHAVFIMLVHRAQCDQDSLQTEFVFLGDIIRHNGYTRFTCFLALCLDDIQLQQQGAVSPPQKNKNN